MFPREGQLLTKRKTAGRGELKTESDQGKGNPVQTRGIPGRSGAAPEPQPVFAEGSRSRAAAGARAPGGNAGVPSRGRRERELTLPWGVSVPVPTPRAAVPQGHFPTSPQS